MKNSVVPTTKKLIGTLALIGLMSVILAKFFSDLAFAGESVDPVSLAGSEQFLGVYQVKTVKGNDRFTSKQGNLCLQEDPAGAHTINPPCNEKVWVYKSADGRLVLLKPIDEDSQKVDRIVSFAATEKNNDHALGSLSAAQKTGVFAPGVIAQAEPNTAPVGGTIGKSVGVLNMITTPFFDFGADTTQVAWVGNTVQVREVQKVGLFGLRHGDVDTTAILTPTE